MDFTTKLFFPKFLVFWRNPCESHALGAGLRRQPKGLDMAKVNFEHAFVRLKVLNKVWKTLPEKYCTPAIEDMLGREVGLIADDISVAKVENSADAKAVVEFLCYDTALCDRPELLRKVLPFLAGA
jgi:hypothetical protein